MTDIADQLREVMAGLSPHEQASLRARLIPVITHRQAIKRFPTPGHLSQFHRPEFLQTPMLDLLDEAMMKADRGERQRIIVNTPPQEGKTSRLQDACAWMLLRNPRRRIVFASYEQSIAAQSSLEIRRLFEAHGGGYRGQQLGIDHRDVLGLRLDPDRAQQTAWSLAEVPGKKGARPGSVIAVGVGSSLSGRPADIIVIDDPIKDAKQADSETWRKGIVDWYQSVVVARLPPQSVIVVVQTRWHEDDLTGWLLAQDEKTGANEWLHLNIPAQATDADDLLGRKPGEYMISARGRTAVDWERRKRDVGTRWWHAMYQGAPAAPEGGIFKREWFDRYRVGAAPEMQFVFTVIDPADNSGDGDEAGIMTGGMGADGDWYLLEDASGHYTVGEWLRVALFSVLRHKGVRLMFEKSLSQLSKSLKAEWQKILKQAWELAAARDAWKVDGESAEWPEHPLPAMIDTAMKKLVHETAEHTEDLPALTKQLRELWPFVPTVLAMPVTGPPIVPFPAVGSKSVRAELASPFWESGKVHLVGSGFGKLENQMATWLTTQDSPDRMDAAVHWTHQVSTLSAVRVSRAQGSVPQRQSAMPQALRSTRRNRR